jgi:hypothetical protein
MSSNAVHNAMPGASGDIATVATPASLADAQEAIPDLPDHLVVTHVLRSEYFDDPVDLARLRRQGRLSRQERLCAAAARSGQLEELKLLRANGCPWDWETCRMAAMGGHLEVLQWARANGCPWDEKTCMHAAEGGHLEVLQWARSNGCPWDEYTC